MTLEELWEIGNWEFIDDDDNKRMKEFVDGRSVESILTEDECNECKDSARAKARTKGSYYGDFAQSNFTTGTKGELGVLNYLHKVKASGDYNSQKQEILRVKPYGDGGIDIKWGGRKIDVKTTGTEYGSLITDCFRQKADLYILAHLKFEGFNRQKGRTHYADPDKVIIYGFLLADEFYETYEKDGRSLLKRASHYFPRGSKCIGPPNDYQANCWLLRPMDEIEEVIKD
tara:strand:+ start:496 stop:1182 length:687 start_codon:yes stop_codon:yes gene_type:complete